MQIRQFTLLKTVSHIVVIYPLLRARVVYIFAILEAISPNASRMSENARDVIFSHAYLKTEFG